MLRRFYAVLAITLAGGFALTWLASYFNFVIPQSQTKAFNFVLSCGESYPPDETLYVLARGDGTILFAFSTGTQLNLRKSFLSEVRSASELSVSFRATRDMVDRTVTKWPHEGELSRTDLVLTLGTSFLSRQTFRCQKATYDDKELSATYNSLLETARRSAEIEQRRKEEEREQILRSRKL